MNFTIVDGRYENISAELLADFEADYLNSHLTTVEIRQKYDLSKKQYSELARGVRDKYGLVKRPYPNAKHYYLQGNRWCIIRTVNKVRTYYGCLAADVYSEEEMKFIVEKCKDMLWDIDKCRNLLTALEVK